MTEKEKLLSGLEHCMSYHLNACDDCPYHDECFSRDTDEIILFPHIYAILKNPGWISTDDKMPDRVQLALTDRHNAVLAYTPVDDMIRVAWYLGEDWRHCDEWVVPSARSGRSRLLRHVSHWMPMVEAPR